MGRVCTARSLIWNFAAVASPPWYSAAIATNIGVEGTARLAYEYGYHQIFAEDAMAAMSGKRFRGYSHENIPAHWISKENRRDRWRPIIKYMESSGSSKIIEVNNLVKRFKDFAAVDNISFSVDTGEIFACLGPNGAGKSTLIKMLITLLQSTSGDAIIDGHDIIHQAAEVRNTIGYVPQSISVDGTLTAYENLMLFTNLYDIPRAERNTAYRGDTRVFTS